MDKSLVAIKGSENYTERKKLFHFFKKKAYNYHFNKTYYFFNGTGDVEAQSANYITGKYPKVKLFDTVDEALNYLSRKTKIKDLYAV